MAKMGRPLSKDPKKRSLTVRMTEDDELMLNYLSKVFGKRKPELIRLLVKNVYLELTKNISKEERR